MSDREQKQKSFGSGVFKKAGRVRVKPPLAELRQTLLRLDQPIGL
jgi:hypothetical protein